MSTSPVETIKQLQRAWAARTGQTLTDKGYCGCDDDNIYLGLSASARREFGEGGGQELGGKIRAAHSSSALACNWFDYWRERDFGVLSEAFDVPSPFVSLRLEAQLPTGMRGADANLDVLLTAADGSLFAVESKFTEPYTPSPTKTRLKPQYFSQNRAVWADAGLPRCQAIAEQLRTGTCDFGVLDVAQLLKHMLALAKTGSRWTLCCLWYDVPGPIAGQHRAELQRFAAALGSEARHFATLTYQELFARLQRLVGAEHADYIAYFRDRYIATT